MQRWDKAPGLSYAVIKKTSDLFSHSTQTQHVRALAVHIRSGPTGCRFAAEGPGLMVWSLHEGLGASLHSWNAFRLCLAQKAGRFTLKRLL